MHRDSARRARAGRARHRDIADSRIALLGLHARLREHAPRGTFLSRRGQQNDRPALARARRAPGAVQVVLRIGRRIHVQDERDAVDVDTPGSDVCGDEHGRAAVLERVEGACALRLRTAAVQRDRGDTLGGEIARESIGTVLGADEAQRASLTCRDRSHEIELRLERHAVEVVAHRVDGCDRRRHGVHRRVGQVVADQRRDIAVERRREQQPLPGGRCHVQQPAHDRKEAEVGHVVGLVEDGGLHPAEVDGAALDEVDESARRRDDDVGTAVERRDLLADRQAAGDEAGRQLAGTGDRIDAVAHLHGEFAGRDEDQCTRAARGRSVRVEAGEQGQAERERLAGAGRGTTEQVAAGQDVRDGRGLDRERLRDAAAAQRADDARSADPARRSSAGSRWARSARAARPRSSRADARAGRCGARGPGPGGSCGGDSDGGARQHHAQNWRSRGFLREQRHVPKITWCERSEPDAPWLSRVACASQSTGARRAG